MDYREIAVRSNPLEIIEDDGALYAIEEILGIYVAPQYVNYHVKWENYENPSYTIEDNYTGDEDFKRNLWTSWSIAQLREQYEAKNRPNGPISQGLKVLGHYVSNNFSQILYYVEYEISNKKMKRDTKTLLSWQSGSDLCSEVVIKYLNTVNAILGKYVAKYCLLNDLNGDIDGLSMYIPAGRPIGFRRLTILVPLIDINDDEN